MKPFKKYSDAGHGWIAVKRQLLVDLGVIGQITAFSYQKGKTVYLEEDQDASTFDTAYQAKYGVRPTYIDVNHGDRSPIRSYAGFSIEPRSCGVHLSCDGYSDQCCPF